MRRRRVSTAAALGLLALLVAGSVGGSTAAWAGNCSDVYHGSSTVYDYAWVSDHGHDCPVLAVRHYWMGGPSGGYTAWVGGTGDFYQSAKAPQLLYGQWQP